MSRCIKDYLTYDSETGKFHWSKKTSFRVRVGDEAGCLTKHGYIVIRFNKKLYYAHRLAWLYVHGEYPKIIDHINRDRKDNRIANLRNVTQKENTLNRDAYNIWRRKDTGKWTGQIRKKSIGSYDSWEDAVSIYLQERRKVLP